MGLIVSLVYEPNNDYNQNVVFWQSPGCGYTVDVGDVIIVKVSTGPVTVAVPNIVEKLTGEDQEADNALEAVGLDLGPYTEAYHPTILAGRFISQSPLAGTQVLPGTLVGGVVSKGPQLPDPLCMVYTAPQDGAQIPSGTVTRFSWSITGGVAPFTIRFLPPNGNAFMEFTTISRTPYADVLLVSSAQPGPSTESGYSQVTDGEGTLFPPAEQDRLTITLTID